MKNRTEPVRHTCPDIDKCIGWLKDAESYIHSAIKEIEAASGKFSSEEKDAQMNLKSAKDCLEDALNYVDFSGTLEELRSANSALRDWGHSLVSECEELEAEIYSSTN